MHWSEKKGRETETRKIGRMRNPRKVRMHKERDRGKLSPWRWLVALLFRQQSAFVACACLFVSVGFDSFFVLLWLWLSVCVRFEIKRESPTTALGLYLVQFQLDLKHFKDNNNTID